MKSKGLSIPFRGESTETSTTGVEKNFTEALQKRRGSSSTTTNTVSRSRLKRYVERTGVVESDWRRKNVEVSVIGSKEKNLLYQVVT